MNNNTSLSLVNNQVVNQAPNNAYIEAMTNSTPMCRLTDADRLNLLMANIIYANFIGGWKEKSDIDIQLMAGNILQDINTRFKNMTELEVRAAFEAGAKGDYGQTFGVSVASCISWLNSYFLDVKRIQAKKDLEKEKEKTAQEGPVRELSSQEKQLTIQAAFNKYLKTGTYHDFGNLIYDLLDKAGMIPFTNAEKRSFLEKGRVVLYNGLQVWRDLQEKRENERKIAELMDNDTTAIIEAKREAKRLALLDYFERLKKGSIETIEFKTAA